MPDRSQPTSVPALPEFPGSTIREQCRTTDVVEHILALLLIYESREQLLGVPEHSVESDLPDLLRFVALPRPAQRPLGRSDETASAA